MIGARGALRCVAAFTRHLGGPFLSMQAATERESGLQVTVMLPSANQSKAALETGFIQFVVRGNFPCFLLRQRARFFPAPASAA